MNKPTDLDPLREDAVTARLRRALHAEAETVVPAGDGLRRIRAGIETAGTRTWWRRPGVALAAAAVVGVLAGGLAVTLGDDTEQTTVVADPDDSTPVTPTHADSTQPQSTTSAPTSPSATATTAQAGDVTVFVYYLRDVVGAGPRLFRERHTTAEVSGGPIATAVTEMFGDRANDPDYTSLWPAGTKVLDVTTSGGTATVDLSREATDGQAGSAFEAASLQQLVWTVTATDKSVSRVKLLVEGKPVTTLWGHVQVGAQPMAREDGLSVRALQWILAPTQGARVGSPVQVEVNGTGYEGTVTIKVFSGATEVASTFVTTEQGALRDGSTTIELPPGDYTIKVYDEYGENGDLREWDSKDFHVEQ